MEKELLMAACAYNLVRPVMCLATIRSKIDPRQLSFANGWWRGFVAVDHIRGEIRQAQVDAERER